jgi:MoaA/NifB/PqqE/SkfB family radical SAM enzyme
MRSWRLVRPPPAGLVAVRAVPTAVRPARSVVPPLADLQAELLLVPPAFLVAHTAAGLRVHDVLRGATLDLDGAAAEAVRSGRHVARDALDVLCRFEPTGSLTALRDALVKHAPRPLTRAALLRGDGYGQLFIELTARCNERCTHCYAESSPERTEALSEAVVMSALDDAAELGFTRVQLTGGDPLISELCVPAARRATRLGIPQVEVYTNGLALIGRTYEELAALGVHFAFSFYSHDPATHDSITRTAGSHRRTLASIRRAARDGLHVRASVIVMDANRDDLAPTIALLRDAGVPESSIGADVQRSVGRGLMTIRPKEARLEELLPHAKAGHREQAASADDAQADPSGRAAVSYDGTVYPCIFSRAFPLGRLPEQRLIDVLRDETPLTVDLEGLSREYSARQAQLACWDCRLRATVLGMQPGSSGRS